MIDVEKELLQARHRVEEAQARNLVKDYNASTRTLIQNIYSGNGNTKGNTENGEIVGEKCMGSIHPNIMVSMKSWRKCI